MPRLDLIAHSQIKTETGHADGVRILVDTKNIAFKQTPQCFHAHLLARMG